MGFMAKQSSKKLFEELEAWSRRKDSFSINDFLKDRKLPMKELKSLANSRKKFIEILGEVESNIWENIKNAIFTKNLPRTKIAQYIEEREAFQGKDPEEVIQNLESIKEKVGLFRKAFSGDFVSSMKCSLLVSV